MKLYRLFVCGFLVMFLGLLFAPLAHCEPNVIPFVEAQGDSTIPLLLIPVVVNNHHLVLLFDTGAMGVGVPKSVVASCDVIGKIQTTGIGGRQEEIAVRADVTIGTDTFSKQMVSSLSTPGFSHSLDHHLDGILGETIMKHYSRITIDYDAHTITLDGRKP